MGVFGIVACAAAFVAVAASATQGALSTRAASWLLPAATIGLLVCAGHALRSAGAVASQPPLWRRHGFWLGVLLSILGLPQLGGFSLIDPWETHYAEVAREMVTRRDFISPWWAHEGWFMSKPVLSLWLEALAMKTLGVNTNSGHVLSASPGAFAHPEWAVRLPGALFMWVGCYLLYKGVAGAAGRRAGFLTALVLATSAQWLLMARQALTDAVFVGALTAAFGLALLAWHTDEDRTLARYSVPLGRRTLSFDATWLVAFALICAVLPQIMLLLLSRDVFRAGSPGNCGLPGQPACVPASIAHPWLSPALQAAVWSPGLAALLWSVLHERRARPALTLSAWYAAGLSCMSKGLAGIALPLGVGAAYYLSRGRLRPLPRIELVRGMTLLVLLVAPWYVAMYARHGRVIFDDLVLRHMLGRALDHLHDTNAGVDVSFRYYVWQMGYALFPWIGLAPAAILVASARQPERPARLQQVLDVALLGLLLSFGLFAAMGTKFHHYILPALPPTSVLIGSHLTELWRSRAQAHPHGGAHPAAVAHVLGWGGALLVAAVGADLVTRTDGLHGSARLFHLFSYQYDRAWPERLDFSWPLGVFASASAILAAGLGWKGGRRVVIALHVVVATVFAAWAGQHYLPALAPSFGQREVIERFYRERPPGTEPLIAYQLNWKGENFYTGNHLAIFVKSGKPFGDYLAARKAAGRHRFDFVLEPSRLPALRRELGDPPRLSIISDLQPGDKFCLVRAELP